MRRTDSRSRKPLRSFRFRPFVEELEPRLVPAIPQPAHVVIAVEENQAFSQIIGNSAAPYINSLASRGALMTNSFAIEHPSQPNYLDLFSGSNQGVTDNSQPHTFFTPNLGGELLAANWTFAGYAESLPSPGYVGPDVYPYTSITTPWVDFADNPSSVNLPFSSFPTDFNQLPTVSFVIPNLQDNMHDGTIQQGDTWLKNNVDPYVQWAQTHNSLLIVTWDEDDDLHGNQIPTLFIGPMVQQGQYNELINHFNVLRTVEDTYALPYAGASATAAPITDVWAPINYPPLDLNWSGGGIAGPTSVPTGSPFTVSRTYTVSGNPAPRSFTIGYYASSDTNFAHATRIGTETISAAADLTVGSHAGTSPPLQIAFPGTYYLFARLNDGNAFPETDPNNNVAQAPQAVAVTGQGSVILDNGQPGYAERGSWFDWSGGYNGSYRYANPAAGSTAIWTIGGLPGGNYVVQATWPAASASNVVYRVYDGAASTTPLATLLVNQVPNPSGPAFGGRPFQNLGVFAIGSGTVRVEVDSNSSGYVAADAIRVASAQPLDLNWTGGGITGPASATAATPFTVSRTYTVSGSPAPTSFTIGYYVSSDTNFAHATRIGTETISAAADLAVGSHAGTSPPLQIAFPGTYYLFANLNDSNSFSETNPNNNVAQAPQAVAVAGQGAVIVDNGQPGYAERGSWFDWSGGYNGSYRYANPAAGSTAIWTIGGLSGGNYVVQATWPAASASNVVYRVYDGAASTTPLATLLVNQVPNPSGPVFGGRPFQNLGIFAIGSGTVRVEVDSNSSGYVAADAIRVVSFQPLDLNWTGGGVTAPASATAATPFTVSRTYTVSGNPAPTSFTIGYYWSTSPTFGSSAALIGTETISAAADLAVGSHAGTSPPLQIAFPGTYYLFARLNDGNAFPETNPNNNVAQAPQAVAVTGQGSVIVDNGQPGYAERGSWFDWSGGYNGSYRYANPETGDTAIWTIGGLPGGNYVVQATWPAASASNVVYRVYDGAASTTPLATLLVNQVPNPSGPAFGGRPFQTLGTFLISSGTVRVEVDSNVNGYVAADAIRVASA